MRNKYKLDHENHLIYQIIFKIKFVMSLDLFSNFKSKFHSYSKCTFHFFPIRAVKFIHK